MLFGGWDNAQSCYLFSSSTQQWTRLPDLPNERWCHNALKINNSIFLVGGTKNNTIEQYEVSSKTFKKVSAEAEAIELSAEVKQLLKIT